MISSAHPHRWETPAPTADRRPGKATRRARTQPEPSTTERPSQLPRRAYGSASTTESDPFSEFQPWASLFHSKIWTPDSKGLFFMESPDSPADVEDRDMIDDEHLRRPSWVLSILDPTTLALNFDHTCLEGLDHSLLASPQVAFAGMCWDHSTLDDTLLDSPQDAFADVCWENVTTTRHDIKRDAQPHRQASKPDGYSPPSGSSNVSKGPRTDGVPYIPKTLASLTRLESSDDSDSDSVKTFEDGDEDFDNGTIRTMDCYGALGYSGEDDLYGFDFKGNEAGPFELENGPRILVLEAQQESLYLPPRSHLDYRQSKSVGQFPTCPPQSRKLNVSSRIAAFCSAIPTKLASR